MEHSLFDFGGVGQFVTKKEKKKEKKKDKTLF